MPLLIRTLTKAVSHLLAGILVVLSLWNARTFLPVVYHWPVSTEDGWRGLRNELAKTNSELRRLAIERLGFRVVEGPAEFDNYDYFRIQNLLSPTALIRESDHPKEQYMLVQFLMTKQVRPLSDLVLVEDLGDGFGLYRTKQ